MLLLAALAANFTPPAPTLRATTTVRIERPVSASRVEWERLPRSQRREAIIRDEQGRPLLLRLIEQQ
jgi:hypothetical protein